MNSIRIHRVWEFFTGIDLAMGLIWLGLVAFTLGLFIVRYTRWGQSHKLEKCMALSVLAHLLLLGYAATIHVYTPQEPGGGDSVCYLTLDDGGSGDGARNSDKHATGEDKNDDKEQLWEVFNRNLAAQPKLLELKDTSNDLVQKTSQLLKDLESKLHEHIVSGQTSPDKVFEPGPTEVTPNASIGRLVPIDQHQNIEISTVQKREGYDSGLLQQKTTLMDKEANDFFDTGDSLSKTSESPALPVQSGSANSTITQSGRTDFSNRPADVLSNMMASLGRKFSDGNDPSGSTLPDVYKLRMLPNRSGVAQLNGGSLETEKAVSAALKWLANNQAVDGHWNANDHGGGLEMNIQGRNRLNAGRNADTGITGLALLAFLASGNTHKQGPYGENVRSGLEYLIRIQARDGNLGGNGAGYEFMYCHAMATCALSEAYGMTHDPHLEKPVRRAIDYTVEAQDPKGGGWRYRPGDPGDTSQLGWQLMALKSADLAGIPMPASTRSGIVRFLHSVSSGNYGGLASYRPGERATRAMTAEALVCWQFLGIAREHPACNEAGDFLLGELPGQGTVNDYYWYYATLGMYQLRDVHWQKWNAAMRSTLLDRQVQEGPLAGSWNTDTLWGSYGGRVYTTAIATLTLEVYYRFLPLYVATVNAQQQAK